MKRVIVVFYYQNLGETMLKNKNSSAMVGLSHFLNSNNQLRLT